MKPKPFEPPAPFKIGQRRNARIYRVGPKHLHLDLDGATAIAPAMDMGLLSEATLSAQFHADDRLAVRVRRVWDRVIEVECADPDQTPSAQFARSHRPGDELTGRVQTHFANSVLVELAPGVIGRIRLRTNFPRGTDTRDFLRVYRPGEPIRVHIVALSVAWRHCELRLTDAEARRWIGPARHRSHWP